MNQWDCMWGTGTFLLFDPSWGREKLSYCITGLISSTSYIVLRHDWKHYLPVNYVCVQLLNKDLDTVNVIRKSSPCSPLDIKTKLYRQYWAGITYILPQSMMRNSNWSNYSNAKCSIRTLTTVSNVNSSWRISVRLEFILGNLSCCLYFITAKRCLFVKQNVKFCCT